MSSLLSVGESSWQMWAELLARDIRKARGDRKRDVDTLITDPQFVAAVTKAATNAQEMTIGNLILGSTKPSEPGFKDWEDLLASLVRFGTTISNGKATTGEIGTWGYHLVRALLLSESGSTRRQSRLLAWAARSTLLELLTRFVHRSRESVLAH